LAIYILVLVPGVTLAVALTAGAWVIASAFLYLQWFHYMRQGYGIGRMYFRATPQGQVAASRDGAPDLVVYLVPIYGIAARSSTMGDQFLGMPVRTIVLPSVVVTLLGVLAAAAVAFWFARTVRAAFTDTLDFAYSGFILSHIVVFLMAYIVIDDVNAGWLGSTVWENFQSVLVVWMANAKRYAGGIDQTARLLSKISQPGR